MTQLSRTLVTGVLLFATTAWSVQGAAARPAAPATPAAGAVRWGPCPGLPVGLLPRDPRQQCATVAVPLDYREPGGRQIKVAISRIRTALPGLRRGVLVMNPGAGTSGLDFPSTAAPLLPAEVKARYDLIGFDTRGFGQSTPVSCGLKGAKIDLTKFWPYPAGNGDISANVAFAKKMAVACNRASGPMLRHITTANTARDMDRIRAALGEPKISYFGQSYGTYLGAAYASLFPQRTDRVVLDSTMDPTRGWREYWKSLGPGTAKRAPDFFAWAASRDAIFHLGRTPKQVRRSYFELAERLDRKPFTLPDGTVFTGNHFRVLFLSFLTGPDSNFPVGAGGWKAVKDATDSSNPVVIRAAAGLVATAIAQLPAAAAPGDNFAAMWYGVVCNDTTWPRTAEQYARDVRVDRRQYPISNGMPANMWPCAFWPNKPAEPPVTITDRGPANIMMAQPLRDPGTPYFGAVNVRRALGNRARMVSIDIGGHTVYIARRNACASSTVTRFLVTGRLPRTDVSCPADPDPAKALAQLTSGQRQALDELRKLPFPL